VTAGGGASVSARPSFSARSRVRFHVRSVSLDLKITPGVAGLGGHLLDHAMSGQILSCSAASLRAADLFDPLSCHCLALRGRVAWLGMRARVSCFVAP